MLSEKKTFIASGLVTAIFIYFFSTHWMDSIFYSAEIWNLPFASTVGIEGVRGHLWPIFPWSSLVVIGFIFQHVLETKIQLVKGKLSFATGLFWVSLLVFTIFFIFEFQFYYQLLSQKNYFSYRVFQGGWKLSVWVGCFYICFHYLTFILSQYWKTGTSIVKFFGGGILIIYVIHFILAAKLAPALAQLTGGKLSFPSFFLLILVLALALSGLIIYLYQSRIYIIFKRAREDANVK